MKPNQARFESFPWEMEILELEVLFDVIDDFLKDEKAKSAYLRKDIFRQDDWLGDPKKILLASVQIFRRQIVVLLQTYLEQIIKDFSINIFIGKPEKMAGYLLLDEFQDGKKELGEILGKNETIALNKLPNLATSRIMKGGLSKILNRIEKISNAKIKKHTKAILVDLYDIRTGIVHEASSKEVSTEFLHESFEAIHDLIASFREVGVENNVSDVEETEEAGDWE